MANNTSIKTHGVAYGAHQCVEEDQAAFRYSLHRLSDRFAYIGEVIDCADPPSSIAL
jgi:hypothetical protein